MTRSEIMAIVRTMLSAVGAYIVGINIFGIALDANLWQTVVGGAMSLTALIMTVKDKTVDLEKISGFIRQVVSVGGGLLVAWGKIKIEVVISLLAIVPIVASYIFGLIARKKSAGIASGAINVADLKK